MKILKLLLCVATLSALSLTAATVYDYDFENPPYAMGPLVPNESWEFFGAWGSGNDVTNANMYAGNQSLRLFNDPLIVSDYSMVRHAIDLSSIDVTNSLIKVSCAVWPSCKYDGVRIYDTNWSANALIHMSDTGITYGGATFENKYGEWNEVALLFDLMSQKAIELSANGESASVNVDTFVPGGLRLSSQLTTPWPDTNAAVNSYFDDLKVETIAAFRVDVAPRGLIFDDSGSKTIEMVSQFAETSYLSTFTTSNSWISLDKADATITTNPTSLEITVDTTGLTIPALGYVTITGPDGQEVAIVVSVRDTANEYEGFDYDLGTDLGGKNGGENWITAWDQTSGDAADAVTKEALTYTDQGGAELTTVGYNVALHPQASSHAILKRELSPRGDDVYFSFLMKPVTPHNGYDYNITIGSDNGDNVGLTGRGWGAQNWLVTGFAEDNRPAQLPLPPVGTTQLMVGKIDTGAGTCEFWSNPDLTNPGEPDYTQSGYSFGQFNYVSLYQQANATILGKVTNSFDEIRIGSTFTEVTPCNAPTDVQASDGTYFDKVEITWNGVEGATQYQVYRAETNDTSVATQLGTTTEETYDDTTAAELVVYYYWVTSDVSPATYGAGDSGYRSKADFPATPENVTATQGTLENAIGLTWDVSDRATKYVVLRAKRNDLTSATDISGEITTNEYMDSAIVKGATYYYWVKAGNENGWSLESAPASGYTEYDGIAYEGFDYPSGISLIGESGGLGFGTAWNGGSVGSMIVADEGLTYPGLKIQGKSMLITATQEGGNTGSYLADRETTKAFGGSNETIWFSFLFKANVLQAGHFFLSAGTGGGSPGKAWGNLFSIHNDRTDIVVDPEQTYLLVTKYDPSGTFLWINPKLDEEPTVGTADINTAEIIQEGNTVNLNLQPYYDTNSYFIDEMHVGRSFAEVTPNYLVENVEASDGEYTDKVALTWSLRSDATNYVVYRSTTEDSSTATAVSGDLTTDSFDDTTADAGTVYYYWIFATFDDGQQGFSYSDGGYRAVDGAPTAPANLTASDAVPDQQYVSVTFDASTGATGYRVYRSVFADYTTAESVSGDIVANSYLDSSVQAGIQYYYWARAKNATGWSNFSNSDAGSIPAILVAYYAMDELESTNMIDSSDNGFDGVYRDSPTLGVASADSDLFGTAVQFDVSDAVINSNTPIRDLTNNFTVAMWVKPDELGTDEYRYLMGTESDAGGWTVQTYNKEVLVDITGKGNAWTGDAIDIDTWTHIAFTYDVNNTVRKFVDGVPLDAKTKIGSPADYVKTTTFIANGGNDQLYFGSLDEVRVYNGVATDALIAELAGVPEPAALGFIMFTLLGLFVYRRK